MLLFSLHLKFQRNFKSTKSTTLMVQTFRHTNPLANGNTCPVSGNQVRELACPPVCVFGSPLLCPSSIRPSACAAGEQYCSDGACSTDCSSSVPKCSCQFEYETIASNILRLLNLNDSAEKELLVPCMDFNVSFKSYSDEIETDDKKFLVSHAGSCLY
jgi:hypothetical protein